MLRVQRIVRVTLFPTPALSRSGSTGVSQPPLPCGTPTRLNGPSVMSHHDDSNPLVARPIITPPRRPYAGYRQARVWSVVWCSVFGTLMTMRRPRGRRGAARCDDQGIIPALELGVHPGRIMTIPHRRHSTFSVPPPAPKPNVLSITRISCRPK